MILSTVKMFAAVRKLWKFFGQFFAGPLPIVYPTDIEMVSTEERLIEEDVNNEIAFGVDSNSEHGSESTAKHSETEDVCTSTGDLFLPSSDVDSIQPDCPITIESQYWEEEFCADCAAALSESALDSNDLPPENNGLEHGAISDVLKKLIVNIEPDQTNAAEVAPCSKNTAVINLGSCAYQVVHDTARKFNMKVTSNNKWDVIWSSRPISSLRCAKFLQHQKANYFPESQRAVWKNNLAHFLTKMASNFPREYDFFPKSWSLPRDWHLMEKHSRRCPKDWFIVKPNNGGCGNGIYLSNEITKMLNTEAMTSQVYISRPLLIDDLKFDLRIYVLLTSCKPLRIFVYNEGLARFATVKYKEPDNNNKNNKFMHLTNYAINKFSPAYVVDDIKGTLRRWTTVKELLRMHYIDVDKLSNSMDDIIIKTIIAMVPTMKYHYFRSFPDQTDSNSCFQIFGFDIMFADDLKVYVLEVNGSPQFHADVDLDVEMTKNLIRDAFEILNLAEKSQAGLTKKSRWMAKRHDSMAETKRRVEWEDSHMGNFRKIYPSAKNKYRKFLKAADRFIHPV